MTTPLSDDFPVLLGPVRVETRFTDTELLVRVFPDEWSVDKFEPKPTQAELTALDAYWAALWCTGGNAVAEQAAWQELSGRIPVGRATFLLAGRQPSNPTERPLGVLPGTVVLTVVTAQPVGNDRQPSITYWTAIWRAHGDRERIREADIALNVSAGNRASTIRSRRPVGIDAAPTATGDDVLVGFLVLPTVPANNIATQSWTVAATAQLLPTRFTVLGFINGQQVLSKTGEPVQGPLSVSPDPSSADKPKVDEKTGELHVPAPLEWLTNFDKAVTIGMGMRVTLNNETRGGVDQLIVLGLREQPNAVTTATAFTNLLRRQLHSPAGLSLLPQGTATNNTEQAPAGQDTRAENEAGQRAAAGFTAALALDDWRTKSDGQWFAELLGIDPAQLTGLPNADGTDQAEARAANVALWPATWGSFLRHTLRPLLDADTVAKTSDFFARYVSGRGPLPTVKIGRQPYGILPTTVFSRLAWPATGAATAHRKGLHKVLEAVAADWHGVQDKVANLAKPGADPHQTLLDILALHPTSAEYHQRYAQSVEELFNRRNFLGLGSDILDALAQLRMAAPIQALLTEFGATNPNPDLLRRLFVDSQHPLLAPLVDDRPLSEVDAVRGYTPTGDNYLWWLATKGRTDLEALRTESGFGKSGPPAALLYFLLRHAVMLGWADAARSLAITHGAADTIDVADREPVFVHVRHIPDGGILTSESRFRRLYTRDQRITGDPERTVAQHIAQVLDQADETAPLRAQIEAIERLADVPTARLERVMAEHLDCATYRLDAWRLGLANERLVELRYGTTGVPKRGIHLGAYGWLENVRPRDDELVPVPLTGKLAEVFGPDVKADARNGGYIHTPSPAHARTAAVLRAGYLANRDPDSDMFAVNLSSDRVRIALTFLDGLRQGQSLGALLGYRFERGLHEGHPGVELDRFIAPLRAEFPLRFGRIPETAPEDGTTFEHIEARNVVDGLTLVRTVTRTADTEFPFGHPKLLDIVPPPSPDELNAIHAEVENLKAVEDALADLAVAEGTHQALLGNAERAAATMDAFAKEGFPPEPAVIETPNSGITLTHRFALQLKPNEPASASLTPRAQAEPGVNNWLPALLPPKNDLVALVTWVDPVDGDDDQRVVTMADLDLEPIDLLWTVRPAGEPAMTELEDRIVGVVHTKEDLRPDTELTIRFTQRVDDKITFFELSPLISALRTLITTARPLRSTDLVPAAGGTPVDRDDDQAVSVPKQRPTAVLQSLNKLGDKVDDYLDDVNALYPATGPKIADIVEEIDHILTRYAALAGDAGRFGMLRSGWGELMRWRGGVFTQVLAAVAETATRMGSALAEADAILAGFTQSLPTEEKFTLLTAAERLLTTKPTSPRPDSPNTLHNNVKSARQKFSTRQKALAQIAGTDEETLSGLMDRVGDLLPLTDFDSTGLDLTPFQEQIVTFGQDLLTRANTLDKEIGERRDAATIALGEYDKAVTGPDEVQAATDALKALIGEDVLVVPEFTPPDDLDDQWQDAHSDADDLVDHLKKANDSTGDFPADTWLHGIARVREMPRLWERAVLLGDALLGGGGLLGLGAWREPELTPIQLPYREDDSWLGMDFKQDPQHPVRITEDKLLFTAHYATGALSGSRRCGLLLDEWTEVIAADRETTGIAVHVDTPDAEPPQTMLLVVPPDKTGPSANWKIADLVDAITETFELARSRAVEPAHLENTAYAQLLPATVMSATREPITISTDLAIANLRWKAAHD